MDTFSIENDELLENYHTIWDKVSVDIKKEYDSKSVYNKNVREPRYTLSVVKLHNFTIKKSLKWALIILF